MRKIVLAIVLVCFGICFTTGCSSQTGLNSKIQALENENKELRAKMDQVNSLTIAYQDYRDKQRLVPRESQIYALPIQDFRILRLIEANSVIQVWDAAQSNDQQLWLYVSVPAYDTPVNCKGWIPESETVKLTKENVKLVQGDVWVKEGTPIYEVDAFDKIKTATADRLDADTRGRITKRQGSFADLSVPGGMSFWVEEKYLIFPIVD